MTAWRRKTAKKSKKIKKINEIRRELKKSWSRKCGSLKEKVQDKIEKIWRVLQGEKKS